MKIHEFQAKRLLAEYGIPIPRGKVAKTAEEAEEIAAEIGDKVVLKAQVHAGGRGLAGGIKTASSPKEAKEIAQSLLGKNLVTHQTGSEGVPTGALLVEEVLETQRELYLGVVVDWGAGMPVIIVSEAGGIEIEELAQKSPEKILKTYVDPAKGLYPFQARELGFGLNLKGNEFKTTTKIIFSLYKLFQQKDCSLAEINPLIITPDGSFSSLDAKLNFDDNALYRHPEIAALRDPSQEDPLEVKAKSMGIENYVKLDGDIGIMVNGAGLAMAVMDAIKALGGKPANFLDIGTVNRSERVVNTFRILTSDPKVKAVLVNIFGGMARIDVIAAGIAEAFEQMEVKVPVVARLKGTKVTEGEQILAKSGIRLIRADTFGEVIERAVAAAKSQVQDQICGFRVRLI